MADDERGSLPTKVVACFFPLDVRGATRTAVRERAACMASSNGGINRRDRVGQKPPGQLVMRKEERRWWRGFVISMPRPCWEKGTPDV